MQKSLIAFSKQLINNKRISPYRYIYLYPCGIHVIYVLGPMETGYMVGSRPLRIIASSLRSNSVDVKSITQIRLGNVER